MRAVLAMGQGAPVPPPPVAEMPPIPTLTDGVVTLREPRRQDAPGVHEQCVDPLSRRWTTVPLDYTYRDALEFLEQIIPSGWHDGSEWCFVVEVPTEDGPAFGGTIALRPAGHDRAEVAYGAHPRARGTGAMERAVRLLLDWGFEQQGLRTVIWWANTGNWASRRLAWRLGFTVDGTVRAWLPQRGVLRDGWVGTLRRDDPREPRGPWLDAARVASEHLVLRPLGHTDGARVREAMSDAETRRWFNGLPDPYSDEDAAAYVETRMADLAEGTRLSWAVADPVDDRLLGVVTLFELRHGVDAEIGYWVHPAERRRGIARGACRMALRHAFVPADDGGLGLGRVRAIVAEQHATSRRVVESLGMVHQGRERRLLALGDGTRADAAIYDLLAEEFVPDQTG